MGNIIQYNENIFENIKHIDENGYEYWYARELQTALQYKEWRNFNAIISKAKDACKAANNEISSNFVDVNKIVKTGVSEKAIDDMALSRYACYLIVMNGDPRKKVIALGQTYFAIRTREAELSENYEQLTEDQKRLAIRREMAEHNKQLADAANRAGVIEPVDYAIFQNHGYKGLYGGMDMKDIHKHKRLKKSQRILDHMGSTELAANLFRATQTEEKLRRENIQGKENANKTHYQVGAKVRQTINELGGTMPEDLPTPDKSIKTIEKEEKARQLKSNEDDNCT